jgi:hypothetical protein
MKAAVADQPERSRLGPKEDEVLTEETHRANRICVEVRHRGHWVPVAA